MKLTEVTSPIKSGKVGSAIQEMKFKILSLQKSEIDTSGTISSNRKSQLDYIFTVPEETENMTEHLISNFLTEMGIFQIHLSGVMKEYDEMENSM